MPGPPRLLIGTSISNRPGDTAAREAAAQASLAALADAGLAACVNLAFVDEQPPAGAIPTQCVLRLDAPTLSRAKGPRKPIVAEMFAALAADAARRGIDRVALVNGDIVVTPAAVERCLTPEYPAVAIARTDVGGGLPDAELLHGIDLVCFDVSLWRRLRSRLRRYPLGEQVWDNVYTAVALAHGGALFNRERLILHERHPAPRHDSPYAVYVHQLATRDRFYFDVWCTYVAAAGKLRARGGTADEELRLQRAMFHPPGLVADATDVGRDIWWRLKRRFT